MHGDIGSIRQGDLVAILSASGESDEILRVAVLLNKLGHPIIAMTASSASSLGKLAAVVLETERSKRPVPWVWPPCFDDGPAGSVPTPVALTVMKLRQFSPEDFALFHPAGQLGRKLIKVREAMAFRRGENLPVASDALTVRQVLHDASAIRPAGSGGDTDGRLRQDQRHFHRRRFAPSIDGRRRFGFEQAHYRGDDVQSPPRLGRGVGQRGDGHHVRKADR